MTQLHQLPLFLGIDRRNMQEIVAHTRFDFRKAQAGETVIGQGQPMTHLVILISGSIHATRQADNHRYTITETLAAPALIHPEHLFGLHPHYPRTITAATPLHLVAISKEDVLRLTQQNLIIQLNLNNIIATLAQKARHQHWRPTPSTLAQRITRFIETRCTHPAGEKTIRITRQHLAEELHEDRRLITKTLDTMQSQGLLQATRGIIHIPALEKLISLAP